MNEMCVDFTTRADISSYPELLSFRDFMIFTVSSSITGDSSMSSGTQFLMYDVGDLLSEGILLARFGPTLMKNLLKPLAILCLSVV